MSSRSTPAWISVAGIESVTDVLESVIGSPRCGWGEASDASVTPIRMGASGWRFGFRCDVQRLRSAREPWTVICPGGGVVVGCGGCVVVGVVGIVVGVGG